MSTTNSPILMAEEYWRNSQLSVARFYGQARVFGYEFVIVNKYGQTLFETSIPPGDPADLVRRDFVPYYKKLGRERFISILKENTTSIAGELKKVYRAAIEELKTSNNIEPKERGLFDE